MILSVIIPMYKVAPYVDRCIRSLSNQNILKEQFEIICINDGSPDNCSEIVQNLKKEFPNIILIDQENQGVSMARNNGIASAKGMYLLFIDPDDYVKEYSLDRFLNILIVDNTDVAITGYIILDVNNKQDYIFEIENYIYECISGISFFYKYLQVKEIRDPDRSVAIFFKRSFIKDNNLKYLKDVPFLEDGELMARILCKARKTIYINDPFYIRTTRLGSATNSRLIFSEKSINGFYKAANNLLQFKNEKCFTTQEKVFMNQYIIKFTMLFLTSIGAIKFIRNYKNLTQKLKKAKLHYLEIEGAKPLYTKMASYYNINSITFYLYWMSHNIKLSLSIRLKKFKI